MLCLNCKVQVERVTGFGRNEPTLLHFEWVIEASHESFSTDLDEQRLRESGNICCPLLAKVMGNSGE